MLTKVKFRGPILFVHKDGELTNTVLPNATHGGLHEDQSAAIRHHAVLMLKKKDGKDNDYTPLPAGTVVTITCETTSGNPTLSASFGNKVSLSTMVNAGAPAGEELKLITDFKNHVQVKCVGGTISATNYTQDSFPIPEQWSANEIEIPLPLLTVWTCETAFTITVGATKQDLKDVEDVYIFNWENDLAGHKELENGMARVNGRALEAEVDFRWMYRLLTPPAYGWQAWIANSRGNRGKQLPAPLSSIRGEGGDLDPAYPPNSACDSARWSEK